MIGRAVILGQRDHDCEFDYSNSWLVLLRERYDRRNLQELPIILDFCLTIVSSVGCLLWSSRHPEKARSLR